MYPLGFFVVLVVKGDDTDCDGQTSAISSRNKKVTLTIHASITKEDYIIASTIVILVIFTFCVAFIVSVIIFKIREGRKIEQDLLRRESEQLDEPIPSPSTIEEVR